MKDIKKQKRDVEPEAKAIGARIRAARRAKKMTIEGRAEAAETSPQFLSKVEKGEQSMTTGKFVKLVKALGVSSDELLFGYKGLEGKAEVATDYMVSLTPIQRELTAQIICNIRGLLDALEPEEG